MALAAALVSGVATMSMADTGQAGSVTPPADMLQDGIDALDAGRPDLARRIFESLRATHPQSRESTYAAEELQHLDAGETDAARPPSQSPPASARTARDGTVPPAASAPGDGGDDETAARDGGESSAPGTPAATPFTSEHVRKARQRFLTEVGDRVFFAENSATIGGRARAIIEAQARWLKAVPGLDVTIIGRAAEGASADNDAALALARAHAVEAKLIEGGVPRERIKIDARGRADPVATCDESMCRAQNRHAETLLRLPGTDGGLASGGGAARSPADKARSAAAGTVTR